MPKIKILSETAPDALPKKDTGEVNARPEFVDQCSLAELARKIQKQTGFPSELKVAKIILDSGWTYTSNPLITFENKEIELDFVAQTSNESKNLSRDFKGGWISINLVIDVKNFSRPLVVFCSDWTDRDMNVTYSDVFMLDKKKQAKAHFHLVNGLVEHLKLDLAGRSAVVINDEGNRPKDFDIHQISSAIKGLYEGCSAVQKEAFEMAEFTNNYSNEEDAAIYWEITIPLIVYDGDIFEYYLTQRGHRLRPSKLTTVNRLSIGASDRLRNGPVYICDIKHLKKFMRDIDVWVNGLGFKDIKHTLSGLINSR